MERAAALAAGALAGVTLFGGGLLAASGPGGDVAPWRSTEARPAHRANRTNRTNRTRLPVIRNRTRPARVRVAPRPRQPQAEARHPQADVSQVSRPTLGERTVQGVTGSLEALAADGGAVVIAAMRCRESMQWLRPLFQEVRRLFPESQVQAVVYELCEGPSQRNTPFEGLRVQWQAVPPELSPALVAAGHFLANADSYFSGGFTHTLLVSSGVIAAEPSAASTGDRWMRWTWQQLVGLLTALPLPLAAPPGVHLIATEASDPDVLFQAEGDLTRLVALLLQATEQPATPPSRASEACPVAEEANDTLASANASEAAPAAEEQAARTGRTALVTVLRELPAVPSLRFFLNSLQRTGTAADTLIAIHNSFDELRPACESLAGEFRAVRCIEWRGASGDAILREDHAKLSLLSMTEYDRVLFVDPTNVVLRSPDVIFQHQLFKESKEAVLAGPDWNDRRKPPDARPNIGVLLVTPSQRLFACLQEKMHATPDMGSDIFEYFFGSQMTKLPYWFNAQTAAETSIPEVWSEEQIVFLHYSDPLPPQVGGSQLVSAHMARRWWSLYIGLLSFSNRLTIFVLYTDQNSYHEVMRQIAATTDPALYAPVALDRPVDPGHPSGANLRALAVGEFAGLLSLSRQTGFNKQWIGYTSWEAQERDAQEGAVLDWPRLASVLETEAQARVVAFWHGIYARDYWELVETHHPGMKAAMLATLSRMYPGQTLQMPKDRFWPFKHQVIMRTALLREFAAFASSFLRHFYFLHQRGRCPFETGLRPQEARANCPRYLGERLLHVWAAMSGVTLKHLVSDEEGRARNQCRANEVHCPAGCWNNNEERCISRVFLG